jgi:hypothetical protein
MAGGMIMGCHRPRLRGHAFSRGLILSEAQHVSAILNRRRRTAALQENVAICRPVRSSRGFLCVTFTFRKISDGWAGGCGGELQKWGEEAGAPHFVTFRNIPLEGDSGPGVVGRE